MIMDNILENTVENTDGIEPLIEKLKQYIDERLAYTDSKNEQAINIALSVYSGQKIIKDKLKSLEDSKTISSTSTSPIPTKKSFLSDSQLEQIFNKLAKQWKEDTINLSSMQQMALHPAYQQIIGLGPKAIPLILNDLKSEPDFWFWALRALTRANPVTDKMAGDLSTMTRVWLDWGREHGYH